MILGVRHSRPKFAVPQGACDCHVHVFGPPAQFPFAAGRVYTPGPAPLEALLALQYALGLDRVVIVQPSPYGTDNRCTLDAVRRLGDRARAVAVIDRDTTDEELQAMAEAGVRGIRINLETGGETDPGRAGETLEWASTRVALLGWHVQAFASLKLIAALHDRLLVLPTPLVIDHFGCAKGAGGLAQPGFDRLLALVIAGKAYVKLSAPHRMSGVTDFADMAPIARALIGANPDRMLWGTDWPHPGGARGDVDRIEPFVPEDDGAGLNRLHDWVGDAATLHRILVDNPARLYGFE